MNNNPFEQPVSPSQGGPTNPVAPGQGGPPANPSMPPARQSQAPGVAGGPSTQPPATPPVSPSQGGPPANPFAAPSSVPTEPVSPSQGGPQKEPTQPVPIVSKTGPGMSAKSQPGMSNMYQPVANEPASGGRKLLVLIIILVIILVLGGLFFASWEGWISLGGIEKYWKPTTNTNSDTKGNTNSGTEGNTSTVNANDQQRKTDLANVKTALTAYYQANQSYPIATTEEKTSDQKCALNVLVPTYLASLPVDPASPVNYYAYQSDGKSYTLTTVLEDVTDPLGIQVGSVYIYKVTNNSVETPQATN